MWVPCPSCCQNYYTEALIETLQEVEPENRGAFSSQEFALQNAFEMLAFVSTIAFPKPEQFKYPATASVVATALAGVSYGLFLRGRRGHLVHFSSCVDPKGVQKDHHHWYMLASRRRRSAEQEDEELG
jgi:iron-regulated transporter 1